MAFVPDDLDRQRELAPVGKRLEGRVHLVPHPGRIGIFVDLGLPVGGFVDHGELPFDPNDWPPVGTLSEFEVLQHRLGQIRLYPLDPKYRRPDLSSRYSGVEWSDLKTDYPIGAAVEAKVLHAFPSNRTCWVTDGRISSLVEWNSTNSIPDEGVERGYRVTQHLDATQRFLLTPV